MKKGAADELLLADGGEDVSGKFLVRSKGESDTDFVLSCIYKGKPTHHALARPAVDDEFTINKQPTGCYTLADAVQFLSQKQKAAKWPLALTEPVSNGNANVAPTAQSSAPEPVQEAPEAQSSDDTMTNFFHGSIKKAVADELLEADDGLATKGKFLIRQKGENTDAFIISVVYKGAPTHHALVREGEGEEFTINKQPTGKTTIADVVKYLATKQPKWPVPLTEGVPNGNPPPAAPTQAATPTKSVAKSVKPAAPVDEPEAEPAVAFRMQSASERTGRRSSFDTSSSATEVDDAQTKVYAAQTALADAEKIAQTYRGKTTVADKEVDPNLPSYLFDSITREESEAKVANKPDGTFLLRVREGQDSQDSFILCMLFRGKASHHKLTKDSGGKYVVNGKPMGNKNTVEDVINHMRQSLDTWPIALSQGVYNPARPKPEKQAGKLAKAMKVVMQSRTDLEAAQTALGQAKTRQENAKIAEKRISYGGYAPEPQNGGGFQLAKKERRTSQSADNVLHANLAKTEATLKQVKDVYKQASAVLEQKEARAVMLEQHVNDGATVQIDGLPMSKTARTLELSRLRAEMNSATRTVDELLTHQTSLLTESNRLKKQLDLATIEPVQPELHVSPALTVVAGKSRGSSGMVKTIANPASMTLEEGVAKYRSEWASKSEIIFVRLKMGPIELAAVLEELAYESSRITGLRLASNGLAANQLAQIFEALADNQSLKQLSYVQTKPRVHPPLLFFAAPLHPVFRAGVGVSLSHVACPPSCLLASAS